MNVRDEEKALAYLHGRLEAQLEAFATSWGIPITELTARLATLLLTTASRRELGANDTVSTLLRATAEGNPTVESMAMDGNSHRIARGKRAQSAIKKPSKMRAYWAAMTKEQRRAEIMRRMKKARLNANKEKRSTKPE
jgi:hypothetical protein